MNFNDFYYFTVIVEEGSLSQAARRLFITQSSLSHFVTNLEKDLGVKLLYRSKNQPMSLTTAGKAYYDASQKIISTWNGLNKDLQEFKDNRIEHLNIGLSTSKCPNLLSMVLPAFLERYPDVKIHMESGSVRKMQEGVANHKYDIVFSAYLDKRDDLEYVPIHEEEVDLVVPLRHPMYNEFCSLYQKYGYISLPWVKDAPFVLVDDGKIINSVCTQYFNKIDFKPRCDIRVEASVTAADILPTSDYLGLIPRHSVALDRKKLVTFPLNPAMIHTTGFYYLKDKPPRLVQELVKLLKKQLQEGITNSAEYL